MVPSPLEQVREITEPASLVVLRHSGGGEGGVFSSSCEDDRATQVDSTGQTTIGMLKIKILTFHLIITLYHIVSQNCNWRSRPPVPSQLFSYCSHLLLGRGLMVRPSWSAQPQEQELNNKEISTGCPQKNSDLCSGLVLGAKMASNQKVQPHLKFNFTYWKVFSACIHLFINLFTP